jgi:serine O-acetyltransferase
MFDSIRHDFRRCGRSFYARLKEALLNPAMWAVFGYRWRRFVASRFPRPIRWLLAPVTIPSQLVLDILTHVQLPAAATIGAGLYLPHLGTIVIGSGSVVGQNCTIAHGVTIGHGGGRSKRGSGNPVIGNRVYIGPGAIVIGPIAIGDDALIGAGAVVVKSVPPRGVVAGNPARLLGLSGSFELIEYSGMESDANRMSALAAAHEPVRKNNELLATRSEDKP